jgi:flagellar L-ring protein precursor FlgH
MIQPIKHRFFASGLLLIITLLSCPVVAQQPSLWQRRNKRLVNQFSDVKAHQTGDLLVVLINERSDVENRDRRLMLKQTAADAEFGANYGASSDTGSVAGGLTFDHESSSNRNFNGNTQYLSEREFSDRFTVMVIDETPNGNLIVQGRRRVGLEGDRKTLVLTGVVRAVDIFADNSISSRKVYNLDIRYEADQGSERFYINQGWLARKFNRWWPY